MMHSRYLDISRDLEVLLEIVRKHERANTPVRPRGTGASVTPLRRAADDRLPKAS